MFNLFLQHYTPETEETIWSMEDWPGTDTKKGINILEMNINIPHKHG